MQISDDQSQTITKIEYYSRFIELIYTEYKNIFFFFSQDKNYLEQIIILYSLNNQLFVFLLVSYFDLFFADSA